jgi:hypothetical protein
MLIGIMLNVFGLECQYTVCHYAQCLYSESQYAESQYHECRYTQCRLTECWGARHVPKIMCVENYDMLCRMVDAPRIDLTSTRTCTLNLFTIVTNANS